MIETIVTRLQFHYFKQRKLHPPMRPFIRPLQGCWGIAVGRHEIGIKAVGADV